MRDIAKEAYEKTAVGSIGIMRAEASKGETIQMMEAVVIGAELMQSHGLIAILDMHRENQSGNRLIDAIQFRRLK